MSSQISHSDTARTVSNTTVEKQSTNNMAEILDRAIVLLMVAIILTLSFPVWLALSRQERPTQLPPRPAIHSQSAPQGSASSTLPS